MLSKDNRVRHRNSEIDNVRGVMIIREIKGEYAICGYNDFNKINQLFTFLISELKITND